MKNTITTMLFLLIAPLFCFAQLNVYSDGKVSVCRNSAFPGTLLTVASNATNISSGHVGANSQMYNTLSDNSKNIGVFGSSRSSTANNTHNIGVIGYALNGATGKNFGVVGSIASTSTGAGVYGTAGGYGAMYGSIDSGSYAGYFAGPTRVVGTLTASEVITSSDITLKENIEPISDEERINGSTLGNILNLNVIKYNYKPRACSQDPDETSLYDDEALAAIASEASQKAVREMSEQRHYGLSAQELQKIYPDLVRKSQDGTLGINYLELVPVLIRSIQELKQEVDALSSERKERQTRTISYGNSNIDETLPQNVLYQNSPNPFKEQTTIRFSLADGVRNAAICIFDLSGKMIRKFSVSTGDVSVTVNGWELGEGMYLYTLMVDGQEIDTKKMIITK
jgi:hypothetical protein